MRSFRRTWTGGRLLRTRTRSLLGVSAAALLFMMPRPAGSLLPTNGDLLSGGALSSSFVSVAKAANEDVPIVTFTGLHVYEDGSSTLFVDLTRTTRVEATVDGKEVSFLLSGAKVRDRNNKNPLIAEYFKTNVLRAKLVDEPAGVRLVVQLREDVPTEHGMSGSGSGARLRVDIPPPTNR